MPAANRQISVVFVGLLCLLASWPSKIVAKPDDKPDELPSILNSKSIEPDAKDDELQKLLKARYNKSLSIMHAYFRDRLAGRGSAQDSLVPARQLWHAGQELYDRPEVKIAFLKKMLEMMEKIESFSKSQLEADKISEFRLELQIEQLKLKKLLSEKK